MLEQKIVVDTSVVAKWFLKEPGWEKADVFLEEVGKNTTLLAAPFLLRFELAHVFWKHRRQGFNAIKTQEALAQLQRLGLQEISLSSLFQHALEISHAYSITPYDACYVALAETLEADLATFDLDLVKQVKKHANIKIFPL